MTLSPQLLERYHADGFLVVSEFLSVARTAALRGWVEGLRALSDEAPFSQHRELIEGEPVLTRTEGFLEVHEDLRQLLEGPMANLVGACFGETARVFKEKINYKHPGGAGYAAHQDAPAYPFGERHITCMIAIDESKASNGGLEFAPGHHTQGLLDTGADGCISPECADALDWVDAPCASGGALLFDSLTPHRSGPNTSTGSRWMLYVTYTVASEGDLRAAYYQRKAETMNQGRVSLIGHFQGEVES